jgi:hypothetical protein
VPIKVSLGTRVQHHPIIQASNAFVYATSNGMSIFLLQMLGDAGPAIFKHPYIFAGTLTNISASELQVSN